jgi:hypothetical protein
MVKEREMNLKMMNMKLPKKAADKNMSMTVAGSSGDEYPYGLRLSLDNEQLTKLEDVNHCEVGEEVLIMAKGTVTTKSANDRQDGKSERRVEIQIKSIGVKPMKMGKEEKDTDWYKGRKKG